MKGFERTFIKAGETKDITFKISPNDLSIVNSNGTLLEVPGEIEISVGGSQPDKNTELSKKTISKKVELL